MHGGAIILADALLLLATLTGPWFGASSGIGCGVAFAEQKTSAQLEAEYNRESSPKKRLSLAVDLMEERLKQMLSAFESDDPAKEAEGTEIYISAMDRLEKAMSGNSNLGAAKNAEIRLRRQTKTLGNLRLTATFDKQAVVDKALTRATKLHEQLLHSIMNPRK